MEAEEEVVSIRYNIKVRTSNSHFLWSLCIAAGHLESCDKAGPAQLCRVTVHCTDLSLTTVQTSRIVDLLAFRNC